MKNFPKREVRCIVQPTTCKRSSGRWISQERSDNVGVQEFAEAAASMAAAATKGAFGVPVPPAEGEEKKSQPGMLERLMGSLTTDM